MNTPALYDITDTVIKQHLHSLSLTYGQRKEKARLRNIKRMAVKASLSKGFKRCTKCEQDKKLTDFYVDDKNYSGYSSYCKECKKGKA